MDGACGGSCSALPGNRRPRAGIGVGGGRCTVLPPRSLITARRGRGRIGWMPKVVGVSSLPWTIGIATVTNKRTAGPHCMCWVSVRPGASVLPVSLWRSVERLRQRQSTERKTDRQAGGSCVQAASSHAAQVQYSRRSRRTVSSRRQGSSCAAPPLHVAHGMYPAICWVCGAGETGTSNWDPPPPSALPCLRGRALPSRHASHVVVWYPGLAWSLPESLLENTRLKIDGSWHWHVPLLYVYVVLRARALLSASRTASHSCSRH